MTFRLKESGISRARPRENPAFLGKRMPLNSSSFQYPLRQGRTPHWLCWRWVVQGVPCPNLIPSTAIQTPHGGATVKQKQKGRVMKDWKESDWFDQWLKMARKDEGK